MNRRELIEQVAVSKPTSIEYLQLKVLLDIYDLLEQSRKVEDEKST